MENWIKAAYLEFLKVRKLQDTFDNKMAFYCGVNAGFKNELNIYENSLNVYTSRLESIREMEDLMDTGIQLIAKERLEQLTKHGRSAQTDFFYNNRGQLSEGAEKLLFPVTDLKTHRSYILIPPHGWDRRWWERAVNKPYRERLIIAGALIAAELDRLNHIDYLLSPAKTI